MMIENSKLIADLPMGMINLWTYSRIYESTFMILLNLLKLDFVQPIDRTNWFPRLSQNITQSWNV
jgi:hypothetical protein